MEGKEDPLKQSTSLMKSRCESDVGGTVIDN